MAERVDGLLVPVDGAEFSQQGITLPRLHLPQDIIFGKSAAILQDYGLDQLPRHLDTLSRSRFDYVITVCDKVREVCPDVVDNRTCRAHWSIPDPAAAGGRDQPDYDEFVRTAAEIDARVHQLLATLAAKEAQP